MKIKELDFSQYEGRRICVVIEHGVTNWPINAFAGVVAEYGELELDEETGVLTDEHNWLTLTPKIYKKKPRRT